MQHASVAGDSDSQGLLTDSVPPLELNLPVQENYSRCSALPIRSENCAVSGLPGLSGMSLNAIPSSL